MLHRIPSGAMLLTYKIFRICMALGLASIASVLCSRWTSGLDEQRPPVKVARAFLPAISILSAALSLKQASLAIASEGPE